MYSLKYTYHHILLVCVKALHCHPAVAVAKIYLMDTIELVLGLPIFFVS